MEETGMFIYWDGYEIDGSETNYRITLPESVQLCEFVECFLSMPFIDKSIRPSVRVFKDIIDIDELLKMLPAGRFPRCEISVNCLHIEFLTPDLRSKLYASSARREPRETLAQGTENPCTAPVIQKYYDYGNMTIELCLQVPESNTVQPYDESKIRGYLNNLDLIREDNPKLYRVRFKAGPNFFYEYAILIMDYLLDHFPGLATWGGLDCAGGWTDGCTYAGSIYSHEKIQRPVTYSIKNTLKRITEYNIFRPCNSNFRGCWRVENTDGFYLINHEPVSSARMLKPLSFGEYVDLVNTVVANSSDSFKKICDTAVTIKLPFAEEFTDDPNIVRLLKQVCPEMEEAKRDELHCGYLAFTCIQDKPVYELRVHYVIKEYLLTLLELMESGKLEFIKPITYGRRHD